MVHVYSNCFAQMLKLDILDVTGSILSEDGSPCGLGQLFEVFLRYCSVLFEYKRICLYDLLTIVVDKRAEYGIADAGADNEYRLPGLFCQLQHSKHFLDAFDSLSRYHNKRIIQFHFISFVFELRVRNPSDYLHAVVVLQLRLKVLRGSSRGFGSFKS